MSEYRYKAVIRRVVDGDTIDVDLDLGLGVWVHNQRLRLYGVDTPEIYGRDASPDGHVAKSYVEDQCPVGMEVVVETIKDKTGKYGRWLALVWLCSTFHEVDMGAGNLNSDLYERGWGV